MSKQIEFKALIAVDRSGCAWIVNGVPEELDFALDGDSCNDNAWHALPKAPGFYIVTVRFVVVNDGVARYNSEPEEFDCEFRIMECIECSPKI